MAAVVFLVLVQFGAEPTDLTVNTIWPRYTTNYHAANRTKIYQTRPELNTTRTHIYLDKRNSSIILPMTVEDMYRTASIDEIRSITIRGRPLVNLYYGTGALIKWAHFNNTTPTVDHHAILLGQVPLGQICQRNCYCQDIDKCRHY